jgi:outer membrane protein assembly factor BamB
MTIRPPALALLLLSATVAGAADWPQWRGPDRSGVSGETGLLKAWPKDGPKLLWTFKNAGIAHSSFAVVADTLYTLGTRGDSEIVIALDAKKGEEKWTVKIGPIFDATGNWGHGPRSTSTVDGDRLYALGSDGDLVCVDLGAKKEVWRKNLPKDFGGEMMTDWGFSESPLIDGDTLICTPGGAKGTLVALNKKDGSVRWQSAELTYKAPYSSAVVATVHGVRQYVQNSFGGDTDGGYVSGFRAKDGKVLWTAKTFKGESYDIGPTPIVRDNLIYATTYNPVTGCHLFEIGMDFKPRDLYSKKNQKVMKNNHGGVVVV